MRKLFLLIGIISYLAFAPVGSGATINWTNTAGGSWSEASNWDPNQVPGNGDMASITTSGTYAVNLDSGVVVRGLWLGGSGGTQTLTMKDPSVYLFIDGGASTVDSNGVVNVPGVLDGGPITLNGRINVIDGSIGTTCNLDIGPNGFLYVTNSGSYNYMGGAISNLGTMTIDGGTWRLMGASDGYGSIQNVSSGVINFTNNATLEVYVENTTYPVFLNNSGTVRCFGKTTINVPFNNSGVFTAEGGVVSLRPVGKNTGTFTSGAGSVISFGHSFELTGALGGKGAYAISDGLVTWTGSLTTLLTWTGGQIAAGSIVTIASNGVLIVNPGPAYECHMIGTLTNTGLIEIQSGVLSCTTGVNWDGGNGLLVNGSDGVIDFTGDTSLTSYSDGGGHPLFINSGTLRKSGGTGLTSINPPIVNDGVIDAESGTMEFNNPQVDLAAGTLNFGISALNSFGRINFTQGVTLSGEVRATLKNGYVPAASNSFQVINYGYGDIGLFTTTNLPAAATWVVNYNQPYLTLTVLNSNPLPVTTLTALGTTNGNFSLQAAGASGTQYILSATTDFTNWTDISTNISGTAPILFTDPGAINQTKRFYRLRLAP